MTPRTSDRVIAELRRADPERAEIAHAVIDTLTDGEGDDALTLGNVQRFAWYVLPASPNVPRSELRAVLAAGAALFDGMGIDRYAAVFRSDTTEEVHDAYQRSFEEGIRAMQAAMKASGIAAVSLDDFAWGESMGTEEAMTRFAVEQALEDAMVSGEMTPGTRGWRTTAARITAETLDSPHPDVPGQSHRTMIVSERLELWVNQRTRSRHLSKMRAGIANQLLHPVGLPEDADEHLGVVMWLLDACGGDGVKLTQAGYLPTAMVREGAERFGWDHAYIPRDRDSGTHLAYRPASREEEVPDLWRIHETLRHIRAIRKRHGREFSTDKGKAMAESVEVAWRTLAAETPPAGFHRAVDECLLHTVGDEEVPTDRLLSDMLSLLADSGWSYEHAPLDEQAVQEGLWSAQWRLRAVGGITESGDYLDRRIGLTPFGRATILEQLRADATGPTLAGSGL